ncbi:PREDICTED: uncharacterized protein LOC105136080 [Populus euphratica]|uniref:Uncharacterized protein LOC105136080 n=1 Tax=Populus euphratica TaxID=75702 RepID=A0AAJ6V0Z3_POPEU|nr:PREDICTED: uncharacterized protein LOC105136080 [Populus euphratica]
MILKPVIVPKVPMRACGTTWGGNGNGLDFACDSSVPREGISGLDGDWRQGLDEPSKYTKKRRRGNTDVSSSSALNSASDLSLSEALSQISKDLSLSSPSLCSGEEEKDKENEEAHSPESHDGNLQAELALHHLECYGVDALSSDNKTMKMRMRYKLH